MTYARKPSTYSSSPRVIVKTKKSSAFFSSDALYKVINFLWLDLLSNIGTTKFLTVMRFKIIKLLLNFKITLRGVKQASHSSKSG